MFALVARVGDCASSIDGKTVFAVVAVLGEDGPGDFAKSDLSVRIRMLSARSYSPRSKPEVARRLNAGGSNPRPLAVVWPRWRPFMACSVSAIPWLGQSSGMRCARFAGASAPASVRPGPSGTATGWAVKRRKGLPSVPCWKPVPAMLRVCAMRRCFPSVMMLAFAFPNWWRSNAAT